MPWYSALTSMARLGKKIKKYITNKFPTIQGLTPKKAYYNK